MARPRRPVQTLQEAVQVQPQASPVQSAPTAAPVHLPIYDFAPISDTIQGFLAKRAREDAARKVQAGERWALEHPELVQHLETQAAQVKNEAARAAKLKADFAWLQKQGVIPPAADPFFQIGYARSAARQLAGAYRDRVLARTNEVSVTKGPDGLPAIGVEPDAILGEEWGKIADSPAIQNFYGGQEALAVKAQVDEEFRSKAGLAKARAVEQDYRDNLATDIGSQFDRILAANQAVTPATLQPITDFVTNEVKGHNVPEPRKLVLDALELSFQRKAAIDPDEAVRAVYAAQDLVVGDVRLGDDRGEVGQRLEDLKARYREMARVEDARAVARGEDKRRLAIQKGESEYVPLLIQAKQQGRSVADVAAQVSERFLKEDEGQGKFEGNGAFVVDALQEYARHLDSARTSDQTVVQRFNTLVADGKIDDADALVKAALGTNSITGEDYRTAVETLNQRRDVSPFLENNGAYNAVKGQYAQSKPTGFTPEVQQVIDDQVVDKERRLERDFSAFVRTTVGKPNREELHRAWLEERSSADLAEIRQGGTEVRGKRDELERDVRERMARYQDAGDLIAQGEKAGSLTVLEAQSLREANAKSAAEREQFFRSPEYQDAEAEIDQSLHELAGGQLGPDELALRRTAYQALRDRYDAALTKVLADPAADPRTFPALSRNALLETKTELMDQLFPGARAQAEAGVKGGESAAQISAAVQVVRDDKTRADQLAAALQSPEAREDLTPAVFEQHPAVSPEFYKYGAAWLSAVDPLFGDPVRRADVEALGVSAAERIQADPTMTDDERRDAIGSIANVVGVDPGDVLLDRFTLRRSDFDILQASKRVATIDTWLRMGQNDYTTARLQEERAALAKVAAGTPVAVDMKGYTWRPFTTPYFRSRAALQAFSADPNWPAFLSKLGIDPKDDAAVEAFSMAQLDAIAARN